MRRASTDQQWQRCRRQAPHRPGQLRHGPGLLPVSALIIYELDSRVSKPRCRRAKYVAMMSSTAPTSRPTITSTSSPSPSTSIAATEDCGARPILLLNFMAAAWTVAEVKAWLEGLGLEEIAEDFEERYGEAC